MMAFVMINVKKKNHLTYQNVRSNSHATTSPADEAPATTMADASRVP